MAMIDIDWRPSAQELRKFGLVVLIGMGLIGAILHFAAGAVVAAQWVWVAGVVVGLPGLTGSVIALPGYWLWMGIAFVMGNIVSRVLLALIYYGVATPTGLIRRLLGHDTLQLRRPRADSHWRDVRESSAKTGYERQF